MTESSSQNFSLLIEHGGKQTSIAAHAPFTIGRSPQVDLVLPYPYISRHHAEIRFEPSSGGLELISLNPECFVNGERASRCRIGLGDRIHLGHPDGPLLVLVSLADAQPAAAQPALRAALTQLVALNPHPVPDSQTGHDAHPGSSVPEGGLARLSWFVNAARRLNTVGAVQEILSALIDTTLQLTRVERGYVFLRNAAGDLTLEAGRSAGGETLTDSSTLSHSALRRAIESGSEFILTDTLSEEHTRLSDSIMLQNIRAVICIPLRKRAPEEVEDAASGVLGVLYLDSRWQKSDLSRMDSELLHTIATEATLLVENAMLAQSEAAARRYREELLIASEIQQSLMSVRIPCLDFAAVEAHSIPCKGIGGDFYDVLCHDGALYVVVADISGKGVSAAVLGSTLQGLIHGQILSGLALAEIALFANRYICSRNVGKYATLLLLKVTPDGKVEYVNCGHLQPLLHASSADTPASAFFAPSRGNLPVGLFADAAYESETLRLEPGQRLIAFTDGVTEAEDPRGHCFGDERLLSLVAAQSSIQHVLGDLRVFTNGAEPEDDCTMVEIRYRQ